LEVLLNQDGFSVKRQEFFAIITRQNNLNWLKASYSKCEPVRRKMPIVHFEPKQ